MKKLITYCLILIAINQLSAQQLSVRSFQKLPNDLDARVNESIKDLNGDKCAIIKVVTTQTGFLFDCGQIGIIKTVQKPSEIWVYVPYGAKRLTITHPLLGVMRDYQIPISIEKAVVYELVLITGKVTTTVEEQIGSEWVVITSEPTGAEVFIDDKATGSFTPFTRQYEYGTHTYRLNLENYHDDAGKFDLTAVGGKKKLISKLLPNFGALEINSTPEEGATIILDGKQLSQTTPVTIEILRSGTHSLTIKKSMFHEKTESILINDGITTTAEIVLKPAYGSIFVKSSPEDGALVILDNEPTGLKTPCLIDKVGSGTHDIKLQKDWYQTVLQKIVVKDGEMTLFNVALNAVFGTLNITTSPDVDIYIDDEKRTVGSFTCRLNEGVYTVEARKSKHTSDIKKVQISVGDSKNLTLTPRPQYGVLEIQSTPIDAAITLNGKDKGTTPVTLSNLLVDDYEITLSLPKYGTITRTVTVKENQTTKVNETLRKMSIGINSIPSGAVIEIDGKSYGTTPNNSIDLPSGKYFLTLSLPNYTSISRNITVEDGQTLNINESLSKRRNIIINSNPSGANLDIDEKYVGVTPCEIPELSRGSHYFHLYKGSRSVYQYILISDENKRTLNITIPKEKNNKPDKPSLLYIGINAALPLIENFNNNDNNNYSYEFFLGKVKTVGLYLRVTSNGAAGPPDYTIANLPKDYYYQKIVSTDNSTFSRMGAVGGLLFNARPILFFVGAGYGYFYKTSEVTLYNYSDDHYYKTVVLGEKNSFEGIETNAGLILKAGRIGFSFGFSSINFEYREVNFGIGLFF